MGMGRIVNGRAIECGRTTSRSDLRRALVPCLPSLPARVIRRPAGPIRVRPPSLPCSRGSWRGQGRRCPVAALRWSAGEASELVRHQHTLRTWTCAATVSVPGRRGISRDRGGSQLQKQVIQAPGIPNFAISPIHGAPSGRREPRRSGADRSLAATTMKSPNIRSSPPPDCWPIPHADTLMALAGTYM